MWVVCVNCVTVSRWTERACSSSSQASSSTDSVQRNIADASNGHLGIHAPPHILLNLTDSRFDCKSILATGRSRCRGLAGVALRFNALIDRSIDRSWGYHHTSSASVSSHQPSTASTMGKRPLPPPVQPQQEQQQQQQYGSNDEQLMKTKMKNKLKHGNPMSAVADGNTRGDGKPSSSAASNKGQATTGRGGGPTTTSKAVKVRCSWCWLRLPFDGGIHLVLVVRNSSV